MTRGLFEVGRVCFEGGERRRFAMPIPLRSNFDAAALRRFARRSKDAPQARRLLALAAIYKGASRTEAARIGGVTRQIVRDWVVKFNAHGPEGLIDRKPPGPPSRLTDAHPRHHAKSEVEVSAFRAPSPPFLASNHTSP